MNERRIGVRVAYKFLCILQKYFYKDLDWVIAQSDWEFKYENNRLYYDKKL